jgi:hypothetical protein
LRIVKIFEEAGVRRAKRELAFYYTCRQEYSDIMKRYYETSENKNVKGTHTDV